MLRILILALCLFPVAVIVPILEIGPSHVFNPDWPSHARLHEVWQLITNTSLSGLSVWTAWRHGNLRLASFIGLFVVVGFLGALALAPLYAGSMKHSDGTELLIGSVNPAVAIMILAAIGLLGLLRTSPPMK
jgi:hypothetical protein